MNTKDITDNINFNSIVSINGDPLPEKLVNSLKNYQPRPFQITSKEDLLKMLIVFKK